MIDYILIFPDETAARAAISRYWASATDDDPGGWNESVCSAGQRNADGSYTGLSVYAMVDGVRQDYPGWAIWVTTPMLDPALTSLPSNACRIAAHYEAWEKVADGWTWETGDKSWIVYTAPDLDLATMQAAIIEPQLAREKFYPFGVK